MLYHPGDRQINDGRGDKDFVGRKGLGHDGARHAGDVVHGDHADQRRALEQADHFVTVARQRQAHGNRCGDVQEALPRGQPERAPGLVQALVHAADGGAEYLCRVGPAVERQGNHRAPERLAQDGPQHAVAQPFKLGQAVVDDEQLHQHRCAAKHIAVGERRPGEQPVAADAHQGRANAQPGADQERHHQQLQGEHDAAGDFRQRCDDQHQVEVQGAPFAPRLMARAPSNEGATFISSSPGNGWRVSPGAPPRTPPMWLNTGRCPPRSCTSRMVFR